MYAIYPNKIIKHCDIDTSQKKGIGRGATASVYTAEIEGNKNYAAKIFHSSDSIDFKRLDLLIENNPLGNLDTKKDGFEFAWPLAFISPTKFKKDSVGFLMFKVDKDNSFYLSSVFNSPLKKSSTSPHWPLNLRVSIAVKISKAVTLLHKYFFVICDFKPENILVNKDGSVIFLDCDSFGVDSPSFKLPPTHFSPGYILPELLISNSPPSMASYSQDLYALSVIIFKILNYGVHPFQGVIQNNSLQNIDSDDDKARLRLYPYSSVSPNSNISPSLISIHNFFPVDILKAFDDVFINMHNIPANFWSDLLNNYIENYGLSKCYLHPENLDHIKFKNMECGVCFINNLSIKRQSFSSTNQSTSQNPQKSILKPPSTNKDFYVFIALMIFIAIVVIYVLSNIGTPVKSSSSTHSKDTLNSIYINQLFDSINTDRIFYNDHNLKNQYLTNFNKINDYISITLNNGSNYSFNDSYYYSFDLGAINYIDFYGSNTTMCTNDSNDIYFYCYRENSSSFKCNYKNEKITFTYTCIYSISK